MKLNRFEKFASNIAPGWALNRARTRMALEVIQRHYEAAAQGRRTSGWSRQRGDVNSVTSVAIAELRTHARDLIRNNSWAKRGQQIITNNTVGWGIVARPSDKAVGARWKVWAESTKCDFDEQRNFAGIQAQVIATVAESGEALVLRRRLPGAYDDSIPLQLQVLEPDYIDTTRTTSKPDGSEINQGVEYDVNGKRVAYWLFDKHPGGLFGTHVSRRVPASEVKHIYRIERPGQVRGVSWFGTAIVNMKDLDDYDDAELVKQKIAACFAAFVVDDGTSGALGEQSDTDPLVETFEPGMIARLPPGKDVKMANPPQVTADTFATRNLRRVAAGLGITYEDMTGDYSQVNFSSARMSRIAHWGNVRNWQWQMLVPQLCDGVFQWAMEAIFVTGITADWTTPPMPMIEPDKEGLAYSRLVRNGVMTHAEMIREQGGDPDAHWEQYAAGLKTLDTLGIKLDSDVRAVSQAGLTQERVGLAGKGAPPSESENAVRSDDDFDIDEEPQGEVELSERSAQWLDESPTMADIIELSKRRSSAK